MLNPLHDPVTYAVPFFFICILAELYVVWKDNEETYELKDSVASISMGVGSAIINLGMKALAFAAFTFLYQFAPQILKNLFAYTNWYAWVLLFFADDFTFYWHHRLSHEVRILWAAHVNHHSSVKYNLSTALRQSWAELLYKYIWWLWLPLIGFHPLMILTMISISLIYQFWIHTETIDKLPKPIEAVFNTPSHHRVHHASDVKYLDRNHGGILIIWDKLFGTFQAEEERPTYGITVNIKTYNPLKIATHEFAAIFNDLKNAKSLKDVWGYLFQPPGWSADGKHSTAEALRKKVNP